MPARFSAMSMVLGALLGACSAIPPHSPSSRPAADGRVRIYIVQRGDTLSEVARSLRVDMRALAAENGLASPYRIEPGQRLRLPGSGPKSGKSAAVRPTGPAPRMISQPVIQPTPTPAPASRPLAQTPRPLAQTSREPDAPAIAWPSDGSLSLQFGMMTPAGKPNDGIDLAMLPGQRLIAAAAGTVLFAGVEPRLGQLVIVDHGGGWATAYAFSGQITVKEGDLVTYRERIGVSGSASRTLHFELRRDNMPRDPLLYLPPRL